MESVRSKEREEEDRAIQALVNTPALPFPVSKFNYAAVTDKRGGGGGHGARYGGGFKSKIPPVGYVCRRCKEEGHFIQHCPTNGDPAYDIKPVKRPTGIPKSMLVAQPDGVYVTPLGQACLQPNEADFDKLVEGLPTNSRKRDFDIPPELNCPLCKKVMKDAVLTGKCCFKSFCDGCIRNRLMASRSVCECGAKAMLADYLIPNMTVRRAIDRIMESGSLSGSSSSSTTSSTGGRSCLSFQFQNTASSTNSMLVPKICNEKQTTSSSPVDLDVRANACKKARTTTTLAASEFTSGLVGVEQESVRRGDAQGTVVQQMKQHSSGDDPLAKKRKREDVDTEIYNDNMKPAAVNHCAYNPYWNGMWTGEYAGGGMGYVLGQFGTQYPYRGE